MSEKNFQEVIKEIHNKDDRFGKGAYYFIREALDHTLKSLEKTSQGKSGHVSGNELLEGIREYALDHTLKNLEKAKTKNKGHVSGSELLDGIRDYALDRFGPMTMTLMEHWNISKCRDFGEIVFMLVEYGILGRTDNDSIKDFENGYEFTDAFEVPFMPGNKTN